MGWLAMILMGAATLAALWRFAGSDKGVRQLLAAALLVGLAGYAWQGRPDLAGQPRAAPTAQQIPESAFSQTREDMLGRFDRAWYWLNMSDAFARRGDTKGAADLIKAGLRAEPRDPDLWAGYGSALVAHAGGMMNPAAELAFRQAQRLAPDHPAPRFYYGLALAQGGDFAGAERIWRALLAEAPAEAGYRRIIEEQLAAVQQARAMAGARPVVQ